MCVVPGPALPDAVIKSIYGTVPVTDCSTVHVADYGTVHVADYNTVSGDDCLTLELCL
jgi:hypothetical protein